MGFDAGDNNFYRYVWNNPITWRDPYGLQAAQRTAASNAALGIIAPTRVIGGTLAEIFLKTAIALEPHLIPIGIAGTGIVLAASYGNNNANTTPPPAVPRPSPQPNNGQCPPHGGNDHWRAIQQIVQILQQDPDVYDIRVNQTQSDANLMRVGNNRPDVQYMRYSTGRRYSIEVDRGQQNIQHRDDIRRNDPNASYSCDII